MCFGCQGILVPIGQFHLILIEYIYDFTGSPLGRHQFGLSLKKGVAGLNQVLFAVQHLFFQFARLGTQIRRHGIPTNRTLGVYQDKQKNDCP